jgi:hypothetical protein
MWCGYPKSGVGLNRDFDGRFRKGLSLSTRGMSSAVGIGQSGGIL